MVIRRFCWIVCCLPTLVSAQTQPDPKVERVRQDLGFYKNVEANQVKVLEAQLQALREEMQQTLAQQEARIRALEQALNAKPRAVVNPAPTPVPMPKPSDSTIVRVCHQGCDTADLQEAVRRVSAGGEINLAAEVNGSCAVIDKPLRLVGRADRQGQRPRLVGGVCLDKAPLVTAAANITIENIDIEGVSVADGNGACVRMDPGSRDLTLRGIHCVNSQDGLLGAVAGTLLIEDSRFVGNGFGNGQAHGIYLSGGDQAIIRRSQILSTQNAGHSLKSGVAQLIVEHSVIAALNGHNSRAIDAFGGGDIRLTSNVIQQGPQSENSDMIGLALEASRLVGGRHALLAEGNWFIHDGEGKGVVLRGKALGPIQLRHNQLVGAAEWGLRLDEDRDNRLFEERASAGLPPYDASEQSLKLK